mmetsp:Transcript_26286/g.46619  ORF Transcript_26286/g.46619 Transcript_26286/m.46619 type:complete len:315 (+) Transcript_26286:535-1479(+)
MLRCSTSFETAMLFSEELFSEDRFCFFSLPFSADGSGCGSGCSCTGTHTSSSTPTVVTCQAEVSMSTASFPAALLTSQSSEIFASSSIEETSTSPRPRLASSQPSSFGLALSSSRVSSRMFVGKGFFVAPLECPFAPLECPFSFSEDGFCRVSSCWFELASDITLALFPSFLWPFPSFAKVSFRSLRLLADGKLRSFFKPLMGPKVCPLFSSATAISPCALALASGTTLFFRGFKSGRFRELLRRRMVPPFTWNGDPVAGSKSALPEGTLLASPTGFDTEVLDVSLGGLFGESKLDLRLPTRLPSEGGDMSFIS